jgi:hypothetical protein
MTFLNPLVLLGLAAASIPLILHLLNLRKPRTIEFSTLAFLKELQQTSIRRLKLRQILLLILRTALIVFIVLAFARPALRGSILGTIGTHAHTSVVLLLDDTFSMSASDERGNLFRQAKEKTSQLLNLLKEGDEVGLLRLSELTNRDAARMTHDFALVKSAVDESQVTTASALLDEGLGLAAKTLSTSRNANKEMYVLSDMQRSLLSGRLSVSDRSSNRLFTPETKFFLIQSGTREIDNAAVDSVSIVSRIFEVGKPVTLTARIYNYGKGPLHNYVVSAYLDGQRVAQRNVDAAPWGSALTDVTIIPKKSGFLSGYIAIEEDAVEHDNKRWFSMYIPEKINVVFVSPSPDDVRYLSLPLTARSSEEQSTLFSSRQITPQQFSLLDLGQADVLVLSNVPSFSSHDAQRIKTFVERGGGLIVFPGDGIDEMSYNTTFLPALNLSPFEGKTDLSKNPADAGLIFQNIDTDHPIFQEMFEVTGKNKQQQIESPRVVKAMKRQAGKQGRTIISLSDQTPFLVEYQLGDGRVLMFSSAAVPPWSDLPFKGLFAPLIHRSALYAAVRSEQAFTALVGDAPTITLKRQAQLAARGGQLTLGSPDRSEEILQHQVQSTAAGSFITFSLPNLTEPGIYSIRSGRDTLTHVAVNVAPRESDMRRASTDEMEQFLTTFGIDPSRIVDVPADGKLDEIVLQSRYGVELWKFFVIAALAVALIEMAVARDSHKEVQQVRTE